MAPEEEVRPKKVSKEEYDIISNRLAVALAKRESLIKTWTASSTRKETPSKTQEERDAEDAVLFRNQPAYLGVGAPIPAHFFVNDASQNNKSLRAKFFPASSLKASKARDVDEKAVSAKRAKRDEDSDEEQGRSALGRAKKLRSKPRAPAAAEVIPAEDLKVTEDETRPEPENKQDRKLIPEPETAVKEGDVHTRLEDEKARISTHDSGKLEEGQDKEVSLENISPLSTSKEDTPMADDIPAEQQEEHASKPVPSHAMDPQEKKRMKKREKKKRMRAKQKAAQSSVD